MPVTVIDKIKQKKGNFMLMDAADVEMSNGKSVEEAVNEAASNSAGKLDGNTESVTPKEVATAITNEKSIRISHADETYGVIIFSNFAYAINAYLVVSSVIFEYGGILFNASLVGDVSTNEWSFGATQLATKDELPKDAADIDLSKYESDGIIVETYADGSTLTHNFEFDADGRPTKRTDSNGNVQTFTW